MANTTDPSKSSTKVEAAPGAAPEDENLLSLDDLDSVINQEDPDFSTGLGAIGPNEEMQGMGDGLDLEYTLRDEEALWKHSGGLRTLVYKIFPIAPRFNFKLRKIRISFREKIIHYKIVLKGIGPSTLKATKSGLKKTKAGIGGTLQAFKHFSLGKKLGVIGMLVLVGLSVFVIRRSMTKGLFPASEELFMGSLKEWAQETYAYEPGKEDESFYDSTHSSQNMIIIPKMFVNLRRSAESGNNPMGVFELYVEGSASDVVVEVKDREAEVQDLFQRNIEEMTFEQLSSGEGKQLLCEKLRKEVNKILTKGKVRRIFIKTAIIKP